MSEEDKVAGQELRRALNWVVEARFLVAKGELCRPIPDRDRLEKLLWGLSALLQEMVDEVDGGIL